MMLYPHCLLLHCMMPILGQTIEEIYGTIALALDTIQEGQSREVKGCYLSIMQ